MTRSSYTGKLCSHHPEDGGLRFTSTQHCVRCTRLAYRKDGVSPEAWSRRLERARNATPEVKARRRERAKAAWASRILEKDHVAARFAALARRRSGRLTKADVLSVWPADDKCPVFGRPFEYGIARGKKRDYAPSVDRFDSSKEYTPDNIHVISWRANRIKNDATRVEVRALLSWMERIDHA